MKVATPKIDKRTFKNLLDQSQALAPFYTPAWVTGQQGEPGQALLNIYLHLQEQILSRLNRVPDKNFVAFLDMMGMRLLPAQSAQAAVTFTLANGTIEPVRAPQGTLLSGQAADGSGEVIFQTQKDLLITPAILQAVFSYDAAEDNIYEHTQADKDPKPFTVFAGQNKQEHSFYLGHAALLNQKKPTTIEIEFFLSENASDGSDLLVIWEYFDGDRWAEITRFNRDADQINDDDGTMLFTKSGTMTLQKKHTGEISETEIGGIKSRWIRCRLNKKLLEKKLVQLPVINAIEMRVKPIDAFPPDLAFNNDVPLNLEGIRADMMAMSVDLGFAAPSPDADKVTITVNKLGVLAKGDILKLDNRSDRAETREIVDVNGNKVRLDQALQFNYDPTSILTLFKVLVPPNSKFAAPSPDPDKVTITVDKPGVLAEGDILKLDNKSDGAEIREIVDIIINVDTHINKVRLDKPLQFNYDSDSILTLFTEAMSSNLQFAAPSPDSDKVTITVNKPEALAKGDILKLDNRSSGAERGEIVEINGNKVRLRQALRFNYDPTSILTLFTASLGFAAPSPDSDKVTITVNKPLALTKGDILKLDNKSGGVETREIVDIGINKVKLDKVLQFNYGPASILTLFTASLKFAAPSPDPTDKDRKTITVTNPWILIKGDILKLDNRLDSVEIREIEDINGNEIKLNEPLLYKYKRAIDKPLSDPSSELTLFTALRRDATSVKVKLLEGLEISGDSKATLYHRGKRETASILMKFMITDGSIKSLKAKNVPENEVLNKLKSIQNQLIEGEKPFLNQLATTIGDVEKTEKFKSLILQHARFPSDTSILLLDRKQDAASRPVYIADDVIEITPKIKPFGELPLIFDTFYIASNEALSKKRATIKLEIKAELNAPPQPGPKPEPLPRPTAVLSWEYWNGKNWSSIRVSDTTDRFSTNGDVAFTCPADIEKVEVNGEEKFWIRARIVDGDYGREIVIEPAAGATVNVKKGTIQFPIISDLRIEYENAGEQPEKCLTSNNLNLEDHTEDSIDVNRTFAPFTVMPEEFPGLFIGFDRALAGGPLSILFDVKEQFLSQDETLKMLWFYWNGRAWAQINVEDETKNLTRIGLLEFALARDFAASRLFGKELFWLKGSVVEGNRSLQIKSLHPNSTYALQADVANNEIAGSSNGTANQEFTLQNPLVISQQVLVRELVLPTEEEQKAILKEEGEGAIQEKKNELGETIEILVRWHETDDFDDSDSKSRHYTMDHRLGKIRFGDGNQGMIPPVGANSIIVSYRFGGGKKGNVPVGAITGLKSAVPFVNAATNHLVGDGGSETEILDNVLIRGPLLLKNRDRAVAPEDFEAAARNASRKVARAKCLPNTDEDRNMAPGCVMVMIVPDSKEAKPEPSQLLIKVVREELEKHCSTVVSTPSHIFVTGPAYVEVVVQAFIVPVSLEKAAAVEAAAKEKLNRYIHPLTGGPQGTGWEFGEGICLSDIFALLESIQDADHVEKIVFRVGKKTYEENVELDRYSLPFSGEHEINITLGGSQVDLDRCKSSKTECAPSQEFQKSKTKKSK